MPQFIDRNLFLILIISFFFGCSNAKEIANFDSEGSNIICFGDSITEGYRVGYESKYPTILSKLLGMQVINAGVSGNTTADALSRLKKDVIDQNPRLVIVELGGNDFLRGLPEDQAIANIDRIVLEIQEHGAMVAIAAVRLGIIKDSYSKDLREIAKKRKAIFIADITKGIMTNPSLKIDSFHPNEEGYKIIAQRIYAAVKKYLQER